MKKLVLATLCGIASAQAFSAEASEDRMQFLESQLKQIQAELEQQKAAQLALKNQQEEAKAQDSKTLSSMVDNVDVYGLIRFDGAVDFKSTLKLVAVLLTRLIKCLLLNLTLPVQILLLLPAELVSWLKTWVEIKCFCTFRS